MAPRNKTLCKNAIISVLSKFIHPSEHIRKAFLNPEKGHRLEGYQVIRQEVKTINRKEQLAVVFYHPKFSSNGDPINLYAVQNYCKIIVEGPADFFFTCPEAPTEAVDEEQQPLELPREVMELVARTQVDNEDLGAIAAAVEIDDDNEPAPENRPDHANLPPDIFKEWGPVNFCYWKRENFRNTSPKISFPQNTTPT
jgi:hypothetical protein